MIFEDRIQVNPRLLRLKNTDTDEVIDFDIQDLEPEEIIQEGTEINAESLNGQIVNEHSTSESNVYSSKYINDTIGARYTYIPNSISTSIGTGSWSRASEDITTAILPAGRYLVICTINLNSSGQGGMGLSTVRVMFDGTEMGGQFRQTIPTINATMSSNASGILELNTETTHTLSFQIYNLLYAVSGGTSSPRFEFIRLA